MSLWLILCAAVVWVGVLFAAALYGERRPQAPASRDLIYALSLAVYCTSWTFYGTVTQADRYGWPMPPTFVGTVLLYLFASGFLLRLVQRQKAWNSTSIADLIATRFGKSAALAAIVTGVAVIGLVPYIALQLKAVAQSFAMLRAGPLSAAPTAWQDSAFYVTVVMAAFAWLFGTRRAAATEHNQGLVWAMAFESVFKLCAFLIVGGFVVFGMLGGPGALWQAVGDSVEAPRIEASYLSLALLGALAMFTLPHQFHIGVVECQSGDGVRTARWLLPLYLVAISVFVLPLAWAGRLVLGGSIPSDLYVLGLPLSVDADGVALLAFLGGLSAATGMVILATLTLAIMIGNHWLAPLLIRRSDEGDLVARVLVQRRVVIALVLTAAYAYSRWAGATEALADIGALAFSALAQLAPLVVAAVGWSWASRAGAFAGLGVGLSLWCYTLLLPALLPQAEWLVDGPFGLGWLIPTELFGLGALDDLSHGVLISLLGNMLCFWLVSRWRPDDLERSPGRAGAISRAGLHALASRFLSAERLQRTLPETGDDRLSASQAELDRIEHELAGLVGASSARLLLDAALRGAEGQLEAVATVLGEASQALSFNQSILQAALANMSQGISVVDQDLRLVAWNQRYAELFAYPEDLLKVGRPVADLLRYNAARGLLGPGPLDEEIDKRLGHWRSGSRYLVERRMPDGSVIEIRGNPMPGGGFVTTYTDISAFRQAETELKGLAETLEHRVQQRTLDLEAAKAEAERANLAKSRFLAAVSHDLLQPLNAAQLFAHGLRTRLTDEAQRGALQRIQAALTSTEGLLSGLLDISKLDAGGLRPAPRPFALGELIEQLRAEFAILATEQGLRLRAVPSRHWVRSDPLLLRRVLQNFLTNALRYTERGDVLIGCRRLRGGRLLVAVYDTGPGIPEAERERIFEEFQRLPEGKQRAPQGLGLGLAIAERIARLLGHPLVLRSKPGRGTMFGLVLPVVAARETTPEPPPVPAPSGRDRRILVLDNDREGRQALAQLLADWGFQVSSAHHPEEAQRCLEQAQADLWILDFHLDHGTGLDAYQQLCGTFPAVPTIVISADHSAELSSLISEHELHLLHKPIKPLKLRALLNQLLKARR